MDRKKYFVSISVLTILIFTACANANTATVTSTNVSATEVPAITESPGIPLTPTTTTASTAINSTLCTHAYYPVRTGATWTYQSTGSPASNHRFTDSITSIRNDGFTLTSEYEKFTRTQEWSCSPDGLSALQLGGPIIAALQSQSIQLDLELTNASGITFPHDIEAGDTWQQTLEFAGDMNIAGEPGTASGIAQANFSALGVEYVSVAAGEFESIKVQADTVVDLNVTYEGLIVPVTYTATYTYWFAPDVGWVKATGNVNLAELSFSENIELLSYSIP
jgi:hypothetical protein